ncbi:MAG: hypothetical protein V1844_12900 [Pseudomonadota bacterium]
MKQIDRPGAKEGMKSTGKATGKAGRELQEARIVLYRLHEEYRRKYNKWCTNDRELIEVSRSNGHYVSQAIEELVENGRIATEIVNDRVSIRYESGIEMKSPGEKAATPER